MKINCFSHIAQHFFQAKYSSVQSFQKVTWVSRGDLYFGFTQLYGTLSLLYTMLSYSYVKTTFYLIYNVLGFKRLKDCYQICLFKNKEYNWSDVFWRLEINTRDPCYPACISGEQAAPQTNEKEDREREREKNIHKRREKSTERERGGEGARWRGEEKAFRRQRKKKKEK